MADSVIKQILDAIVTRAQTITTANGYNTDAGNQVYLGRRNFTNIEAFPIISISRGPEELLELVGERMKLAMPVTLEGLIEGDQDNPLTAAEELIADIKMAVCTTSDRLGGLAIRYEFVTSTPTVRDDGANFVGATVETLCTYVEYVGNPYAT